jgi:hypothetical protein
MIDYQETVHSGFRQVSSKETKSLVIPALFELYTVKSTRGLELPLILSIYQKPAKNLPETSTAGFRRFPDNPSLTDHTVTP